MIVHYSFAQDSLEYAQTFQLENIQYTVRAGWGEDWTEKQFQEANGNYFDSIATFIKSNPQAKFEIRCYTDSRGKDSLNLALSQKRADDWVNNLIVRGVDSIAIEGIGVGEMFDRKVWCKDSLYFVNKPNDQGAIEVQLTEGYINSFRRDKDRFEHLHRLNRRAELTVSELDEDAQRIVNSDLRLKEFYGNRNVVKITSGRIENTDSFRIEHTGDLHLHLVAPGTENEFTIRSLNNKKEVYSYNKFASGKESLLDISTAHGLYEIEVFGDGGSGVMILDIVFQE